MYLYIISNISHSIIHSCINYPAERKNNEISSSSVYINNEDWTGWFCWQLGICVVTNQITSWRTVLSAAGRRSSIFQRSSTPTMAYMGINLLLNSINRGLSIFNYRKKGIFYRANYYTVISLVNFSTVITTKRQLVKICNVSINLSSWFTSTSWGI